MTQMTKEIIEIFELDSIEKFIKVVENVSNITDANYSTNIHSKNLIINNNHRNETSYDMINEDGLTLLHLAAFYDALDCFIYLHETKKLPLNIKSTHLFLPLHYACWSGSKEIALYILSRDPSEALATIPNTRVQLIYCSIMGGDISILQSLFNNGANLINSANDKNFLIKKAIGLHQIDLLKLIYQNIKESKSNQFILSPAAKSIFDYNVEAFNLLYNKQEIIFTSEEGKSDSLVHIICEYDTYKNFKNPLLQILDDAVKLNLDLEPSGNIGEGLCHFLCQYCDLDVARKMINLRNFKVNRLNENKKSGAFKLTIKQEHDAPEILQLLINNGLNIERADKNSPSLLEAFCFSMNKMYKSIEVLLNNGADMNVPCKKNNKGMPIYDFVMKTNDQKLKNLFIKYHKE